MAVGMKRPRDEFDEFNQLYRDDDDDGTLSLLN
jgi:hypothetical protein